ncbi:MAG: IS110 family transposase [Candidatus Omnitrophota bacterium]
MAISSLSKNYDTFVGIDVDKKKFSFTVIDDNTIKRSKTIPSSPNQLYNYISKKYSKKRVLYAYEAGPTGYHLYDYLKSNNCGCLVVSPNTIPKASNDKVKNNKMDSKKIAENLNAGRLKSIRVPTGNYRELRNLVRIRQNYAAMCKKAKQRIKALLLHANLYSHLKEPESKWSSRFTQALKEIPCTDAVGARLDMLIMDLDYAHKQLLTSHRHLRAFIKQNPDIQYNLNYAVSVSGIGFITAVTLFAKSGNPKNLKNPRELAGFIGLAPTENSTGDKERKGPISHLGDSNLRALFIEAAWVAIRKEAGLRQFYYRIVSRNHPKGASQKAIVAVARKLTERLYRVLKDQRRYIVH